MKKKLVLNKTLAEKSRLQVTYSWVINMIHHPITASVAVVPFPSKVHFAIYSRGLSKFMSQLIKLLLLLDIDFKILKSCLRNVAD